MDLEDLRCELVEGKYEIHVRGTRTSECLSLLDPLAPARIVRFGATGYEGRGWATEHELPALRNVGELRALLQRSALGLIELDIDVDGFGRLTSRDEEECAFYVSELRAVLAIVKKLLPSAHAGQVVHELLRRPALAKNEGPLTPSEVARIVAKIRAGQAFLIGTSGRYHWQYFWRDGAFIAQEFDLPHCVEHTISEEQLRAEIARKPLEWRERTSFARKQGGDPRRGGEPDRTR